LLNLKTIIFLAENIEQFSAVDADSIRIILSDPYPTFFDVRNFHFASLYFTELDPDQNQKRKSDPDRQLNIAEPEEKCHRK